MHAWGAQTRLCCDSGFPENGTIRPSNCEVKRLIDPLRTINLLHVQRPAHLVPLFAVFMSRSHVGERQLNLRSVQEILRGSEERQRTNKSQVTEPHEYVHLAKRGATGGTRYRLYQGCSCRAPVLFPVAGRLRSISVRRIWPSVGRRTHGIPTTWPGRGSVAGWYRSTTHETRFRQQMPCLDGRS